MSTESSAIALNFMRLNVTVRPRLRKQISIRRGVGFRARTDEDRAQPEINKNRRRHREEKRADQDRPAHGKERGPFHPLRERDAPEPSALRHAMIERPHSEPVLPEEHR